MNEEQLKMIFDNIVKETDKMIPPQISKEEEGTNSNPESSKSDQASSVSSKSKQKPPKKDSKAKAKKEKENIQDDARRTARTPTRGPLDHYVNQKQNGSSQSRKRISVSPAAERRTKGPKLNLKQV